MCETSLRYPTRPQPTPTYAGLVDSRRISAVLLRLPRGTSPRRCRDAGQVTIINIQ